jgi:hypothetical protein
MLLTALSRSGTRVTLPDRTWIQIVEEHCELAGMRMDVIAAVESGERILEGVGGLLYAVRSRAGAQALVVVYREQIDNTGEVVTAFITGRVAQLMERQQLWPPCSR